MRGGGLSRLASLSALRRFDNRDRSSPALFRNNTGDDCGLGKMDLNTMRVKSR